MTVRQLERLVGCLDDKYEHQTFRLFPDRFRITLGLILSILFIEDSDPDDEVDDDEPLDDDESEEEDDFVEYPQGEIKTFKSGIKTKTEYTQLKSSTKRQKNLIVQVQKN